MSEVTWPRYFRNSAKPALTARQDAPGLTSNIYLWGELQKVTQSASSVGNFVRYGVWIETDANGNELVREPVAQAEPVVRYACTKAAKVGDRVKFAGHSVSPILEVTGLSENDMCHIKHLDGTWTSLVDASSLEFVPEVEPQSDAGWTELDAYKEAAELNHTAWREAERELATYKQFHAAIVTAMNHEHNPTRFALAVSRALAKVEQKSEVRCES